MNSHVVAVALLTVCASLAHAEDQPVPTKDPIVGQWHLLTVFAGQEMTSQITISRVDGRLKGTYRDSRGDSSELRDLSFEHETLTFQRSAGPRTIGFRGTVRDDKIEGAHRVNGREIPAHGVRSKKALDELLKAHRKANERGDDLEADYEKHKRRAAPRDAFPVLHGPTLSPVEQAKGLVDDEPVIGVFLGGEAKAYPISIMGIHELVNDTCGGQPIAASW